MPYRPPNRFTAGRPVETAAADMNFMAMVDYSDEVDTTLGVINTDIGLINTDIAGLGTDIADLSTYVDGEITGTLAHIDGSIADLDADLTAYINSQIALVDADVAALDAALTVVEGDVLDLYDEREAWCHIYTGSSYSIPDATNTEVLFDSEYYDPLGWHSTSTLTGRIFPNIAGWYEIQGTWDFSAGGFAATDRIIASLQVNTASIDPTDRYAGSASPGGSLKTGRFFFNGTTDYARMLVFQNSGAAADIVARLQLTFIHP